VVSLQKVERQSPGEGDGRRRTVPEAEKETPSAMIQSHEEADMVRSALEKITDPTDREIVHLRFFENLSLRQISARLELTYDKVRERYRVVMSQLERELGRLA
jgi:RNA polymerase sigma factor (sigma-70 family)